MAGLLVDQVARTLGVLRTRRAAAALLAGLTTSSAAALRDAVAGPKKTRRKRRKPDGGSNACRRRCDKKQHKQARRRCRRRCQADRPCATDRDCGPCARCEPQGCVTTCRAGEVCEQDRCAPGACPIDGTEMVVASYAKVEDGFARGSAVAIPAGPDAVANFVNGRFTDLYDQFSAELQGLISPDDLDAFAFILQHNRVHFEVPSAIGTFDGYFEDGVIEGYFTQIFTFSFWIEATESVVPGTLEGQWVGEVYDPTGSIYQTPFDIVVTFAMESGQLTGALDVAGVADDLPITDISISENRPLSTAPSGEVRISPQPEWTWYSTLVAWGAAHMAFSFVVDPEGVIVGLDIVPDWPVPPDPAAGVPIETAIRLPFNGTWWIGAGGPRQYENHHATDPASRHAYDFLVWNEHGSRQPNAGENADVWAWEQPLFAPAAGTVVDLANNVPDNQLGVVDPSGPGNMIVLQTAPQEFLLMGHLREGSVAVALGEQVQEGQFIARIGNSGYSFGPHLHMQFQNRYDVPFHPETLSLPFRFKDLLVNGRPEANPSPVMGDFVQHAGCPTPVLAEGAPRPGRERSNRPARGRQERPLATRRSAESFRSPAAVPVDLPPLPWGER